MKTLASERVMAGISQQKLADELNVSKSTVSRWERGAGEPNGSMLVAMSRIFGCSTDYLLGLTTDRRPVSTY